MAKTEIIAAPGSQEVVITREFDAPRELLFRAYTEPELLVQWLGPLNYNTIVDRYELRDGGTWRYRSRDAEGNEFGFHGVFHGDPSPDGMVQTFEYEGAPGHVSLQTAVFEQRGEKTLVRTSAVFQSVADRDEMVESGMESGVNEGMERLDELLPRLARAS